MGIDDWVVFHIIFFQRAIVVLRLVAIVSESNWIIHTMLVEYSNLLRRIFTKCQTRNPKKNKQFCLGVSVAFLLLGALLFWIVSWNDVKEEREQDGQWRAVLTQDGKKIPDRWDFLDSFYFSVITAATVGYIVCDSDSIHRC